MHARRAAAIALAVIISLGSTACTIQKVAPPEEESDELGVLDAGTYSLVHAEMLCEEAGTETLYHACGHLASYLATSVYDIDLAEPDDEDFWLMLSIVTYGAFPERVGEFGTIDLTAAEVKDVAETFFPEYMEERELPSTKDSYAAEYVSAEGLYELQPMTVGQITYELLSLSQRLQEDGTVSMTLRLVDEKQKVESPEWHVKLKRWEDDQEHMFPCRVLYIRPIS